MESRRVRVCLHPRELLWLQRPDHQMNAICQTGRAPTKKHHQIVLKKKKKNICPPHCRTLVIFGVLHGVGVRTVSFQRHIKQR